MRSWYVVLYSFTRKRTGPIVSISDGPLQEQIAFGEFPAQNDEDAKSFAHIKATQSLQNQNFWDKCTAFKLYRVEEEVPLE